LPATAPSARASGTPTVQTCRAVCHLTASAAKENTVIAAIAQNMFPDVYRARLAETLEAGASTNIQMPIFFYNENRPVNRPPRLSPRLRVE